jgi:heat-inducible transcriptional repressor
MTLRLTDRQREILRRVVEEYVSSGQPVGSKYLVERSGMAVSASTVRNELAVLEEQGLLTHPHTSAGRVPTEAGYRLYADELLGRLDARPNEFPLDLGHARTELEAALQETTEMLSQVTRLLALVSAPPFESTTVRHVEVLLLQPHVVMAVVITSAGGVSKRAVEFPDPVDPGLAAWAREYLNETLSGVTLGSRELRRRLEEAGLSPRERAFLDALRPAFTELLRDEQRVYVGGAATLLDEVRVDELDAYRRLLEVLERRAALLDIVGDPFEPRRAFVRGGVELDNPALRDAALVGSSYGLAHRTLGAVSLLGPVRMDYDKALRSVRAAAVELSRFVEAVYEER